MTPDPQPCLRVTTYTFDAADRLIEVRDQAGPGREPQPPPLEPLPRPRAALFDFEHDAEKGIFLIKWLDGTIEVFRHNPVRYLVVEPDAETGELKPVVKRGCPTYLYLSREEREIR